MTLTLGVALKIVALVLFGLAAFFTWYAATNNRGARINFVAAGLFFWLLGELLAG